MGALDRNASRSARRMVAGIIVAAGADELVIAHPTEEATLATVILRGASHYIQEDTPEEIVAAIKDWWPGERSSQGGG